MQACLPTATATIDYNIGLLDVLAKKPSLMSARFRVEGGVSTHLTHLKTAVFRVT